VSHGSRNVAAAGMWLLLLSCDVIRVEQDYLLLRWIQFECREIQS
jgi:hypothetical protein